MYKLTFPLVLSSSISSLYGSTLPKFDSTDSLCKKWFKEQPDPLPVINALPPLKTISQLTKNKSFPNAFGDFQIDLSCNPSQALNWWMLRRGPKSCYRSITSYNGAGQQCCYSEKKTLLVGFPGGGTLDLACSL